MFRRGKSDSDVDVWWMCLDWATCLEWRTLDHETLHLAQIANPGEVEEWHGRDCVKRLRSQALPKRGNTLEELEVRAVAAEGRRVRPTRLCCTECVDAV